jgi:ribulose bisphosphate carboxylase small subunit
MGEVKDMQQDAVAECIVRAGGCIKIGLLSRALTEQTRCTHGWEQMLTWLAAPSQQARFAVSGSGFMAVVRLVGDAELGSQANGMLERPVTSAHAQPSEIPDERPKLAFSLPAATKPACTHLPMPATVLEEDVNDAEGGSVASSRTIASRQAQAHALLDHRTSSSIQTVVDGASKQLSASFTPSASHEDARSEPECAPEPAKSPSEHGGLRSNEDADDSESHGHSVAPSDEHHLHMMQWYWDAGCEQGYAKGYEHGQVLGYEQGHWEAARDIDTNAAAQVPLLMRQLREEQSNDMDQAVGLLRQKYKQQCLKAVEKARQEARQEAQQEAQQEADAAIARAVLEATEKHEDAVQLAVVQAKREMAASHAALAPLEATTSYRSPPAGAVAPSAPSHGRSHYVPGERICVLFDVDERGYGEWHEGEVLTDRVELDERSVRRLYQIRYSSDGSSSWCGDGTGREGNTDMIMCYPWQKRIRNVLDRDQAPPSHLLQGQPHKTGPPVTGPMVDMHDDDDDDDEEDRPLSERRKLPGLREKHGDQPISARRKAAESTHKAPTEPLHPYAAAPDPKTPDSEPQTVDAKGGSSSLPTQSANEVETCSARTLPPSTPPRVDPAPLTSTADAAVVQTRRLLAFNQYLETRRLCFSGNKKTSRPWKMPVRRRQSSTVTFSAALGIELTDVLEQFRRVLDDPARRRGQLFANTVVSFVGLWGTPEDGFDLGGLTAEMYSLVWSEVRRSPNLVSDL